MTQPTPADVPDKAPADKPAPTPAKQYKRLDVVEYTHKDRLIPGREHQAVGVVTAVRDGAVTIRPLAGHSIDVDPADVAGIIGADAV